MIYEDKNLLRECVRLVLAYIWVSERVRIGGHWRPYEMIFDDYTGWK